MTQSCPLRFSDLSPSVFARHGWRIAFARDASTSLNDLRLRWDDPKRTLQLLDLPDTPGKLLLRFFDLAAAWIDTSARVVEVFPLQPDLSEHTFEHFVMDVVLPRVISSDTSLVLHGGLVAQGDDGICLIGDSGAGKSTLVAAMRQSGWQFHGDDALVLETNGSEVTAVSTYPSLRLFPDSVDTLFGKRPNDATPVADYLEKLRIDPQETAPTTAPSRLRAIFLLGKKTDANEPTVKPMLTSKLCMALVGQSFALDPTDSASAHLRLSAASATAAKVAGYELNYPRDFDRLPEVVELLCSTLEQVRPS